MPAHGVAVRRCGAEVRRRWRRSSPVARGDETVRGRPGQAESCTICLLYRDPEGRTGYTPGLYRDGATQWDGTGLPSQDTVVNPPWFGRDCGVQTGGAAQSNVTVVRCFCEQ